VISQAEDADEVLPTTSPAEYSGVVVVAVVVTADVVAAVLSVVLPVHPIRTALIRTSPVKKIAILGGIFMQSGWTAGNKKLFNPGRIIFLLRLKISDSI
jgi:hypothetical protein